MNHEMPDMTSTADLGKHRCTCCAGPFRAHDLGWCSLCGEPFHLALRIDIPVAECGEAWIDDELEAVQFGCNRCLQSSRLRGAAAGP